MKRIVVLSFTRMGDLVQSTPLLRSLKKRYPHAEVTIIVLRQFAEMAKMLPMIDKVVEFDVDRFVAGLDGRGQSKDSLDSLNDLLQNDSMCEIDLLVNLSHTKQSATLCSILKPREFIGLSRDACGNLVSSNEWTNYLLSIMESREGNPYNLVEIYNRFVPEYPVTGRLELQPSEDALVKVKQLLDSEGIDISKPLIALHPGASHPSRCWQPASYGELAKRLGEVGYQIVVIGDHSESKIADEVVEASAGYSVSMAGKSDVVTLTALLKLPELLICNDSGPAHIAAAVNTRALAIFLGPASAKDTAPYGNGHIILEANLPCAPCSYQQPCKSAICKEIIDVESVFRTASRMIEGDFKFSGITGKIKIQRTNVDSSGRFKLENISGQIENSSRKLGFYRWFWDNLLSYDAYPTAKHEKIQLNNTTDLKAVCERAKKSLQNLKSAISNSDNHLLESSINDQLRWQNELRNLMTRSSDYAPFVRFLLVKCVLVRTAQADQFYEDLRNVLNWFERGLNLISMSQNQKAFSKFSQRETILA